MQWLVQTFADLIADCTILEVRPHDGRLVVVKGDDLAAFWVDPARARIHVNGTVASLSDLKYGDQISVAHDCADEAITIDVATQRGRGPAGPESVRTACGRLRLLYRP